MDDLCDLAYEAAIVPERWMTFLDAGAELASGHGGTLAAVEGMSHTSIISERLHDAWHAIINSEWVRKNPLPSAAVLNRRPGFVFDSELISPTERAKSPWFNDFAPKWNLGPSMGTVLQVPNGGRLVVSFERPISAPPYERADAERFDRMRPTLARAIALGSQLAFQQYQSTTGVLNSLGLPGAVVNQSGRLLSANALFETLIPTVFTDNQSRLHIVRRSSDAIFQQTLTRLRPDEWGGAVASIPIPRNGPETDPAIVHVLPIRGVGRDILFGATCILVVDTLAGKSPPSDMILRALYDLTPAEARVAAALAEMRAGPAKVAERLGVSPETVKSQSKSIYQKTGLSDAMDLVSVLGGLLQTHSNIT